VNTKTRKQIARRKRWLALNDREGRAFVSRHGHRFALAMPPARCGVFVSLQDAISAGIVRRAKNW
jgi:hypothetical protein